MLPVSGRLWVHKVNEATLGTSIHFMKPALGASQGSTQLLVTAVNLEAHLHAASLVALQCMAKPLQAIAFAGHVLLS
jgi:hypothetical protein